MLSLQEEKTFSTSARFLLHVCSVTVCFPRESTVFWCLKRVCVISQSLFEPSCHCYLAESSKRRGETLQTLINDTQFGLWRGDLGLILRLLGLWDANPGFHWPLGQRKVSPRRPLQLKLILNYNCDERHDFLGKPVNPEAVSHSLPLSLLLPGLNSLKCPKVAPGSCLSNEGRFPYVYSHSHEYIHTYNHWGIHAWLNMKTQMRHESKWAASFNLLLFGPGQDLTHAKSISQTYLTVYLRTYLHLLSAAFHPSDPSIFLSGRCCSQPCRTDSSGSLFQQAHTCYAYVTL